MDAIIWAIAIPIGIILLFAAVYVGAIVLVIALPILLIIGGLSVGGPIGGILLLIGLLAGAFLFAFVKDELTPPPDY